MTITLEHIYCRLRRDEQDVMALLRDEQDVMALLRDEQDVMALLCYYM